MERKEGREEERERENERKEKVRERSEGRNEVTKLAKRRGEKTGAQSGRCQLKGVAIYFIPSSFHPHSRHTPQTQTVKDVTRQWPR